jgi:sulfotransferase family protein
VREADKDPAASPLIILCSPRSFSSVICAMLGQHPMAYGFPELNVFAWKTVGDLLALDEDTKKYGGVTLPQVSAGLCRAVAELIYGDQTPRSLTRSMTWLQSHSEWPTCRVFDILLRQVAPRCGIEKSPSTAMSLNAMHRAISGYPNARFLHLTRHPATAVESMLESHRKEVTKQRFAREVPDLATYYTRLWCLAQRSILSFVQTLNPALVMRVRAEDLVSEGNEALVAVADWLKLSCDFRAIEGMRHPERSAYASVAPDLSPSENDPNFMRSPALRPRSVAGMPKFPDTWKLPSPVVAEATSLARMLCYPF